MNGVVMTKGWYMLQEKYPELVKLFLYFCIGISAAVIDYGIFFVTYNFMGIGHFIATALSTTVAVVYAYSLNVKYNFKVKTHLVKRFLSYFSVNLVGLAVSFLFLYIFATKGDYSANVVKAASLPAIFIIQFALNRLITFQKTFFHKEIS